MLRSDTPPAVFTWNRRAFSPAVVAPVLKTRRRLGRQAKHLTLISSPSGRACIPSLPAKPKITFRTREDQARQRVRYRLQTPSRYVELQCSHCSKASSNRSSRTKCGLRNIFCHFAASDGTIFPWKGWHSLLTSVHHDGSLRARFHVRRAAGPLLIT